MCEYFFGKADSMTSAQIDYDDYVDAFAALEAFITARGLPFDCPVLGPDRSDNISRIRRFFATVFTSLDARIPDLTLAQAREKYRRKFGVVFLYEFSDGDLARIQALINELRELIVRSEMFDAKHKERILAKLEGLQRELHKKVSSLDKFWGLIGDAGVVLGKFGKDAKPLVDRIKEITQIIWRTQARAEELPSGSPFPLLPAPQTPDQTGQPNQQSEGIRR
jgi:hypothetical protein